MIRVSLLTIATLAWLLLASISGALHAQENQLTIHVPYVELHSGPSDSYPVIRTIEKNETITVLFKRTSWIKIRDKRGVEGWVNEEQLSQFALQDEPITDKDFSSPRYQERTWEAGVMYGDLSGANFYQIYADLALGEVFSAELSAGKALGSFSDSDVFEAMLYSQLVPEWPVIPYIGIGGGIIDITPHSIINDSETRQHTLMSAGVGVKYPIARHFVIRAEYKYSLALTDRDENEEIQTWKLGFSVFF